MKFLNILSFVFLLAFSATATAQAQYRPTSEFPRLAFVADLPGVTVDGHRYLNLFAEAAHAWATATGYFVVNTVTERPATCGIDTHCVTVDLSEFYCGTTNLLSSVGAGGIACGNDYITFKSVSYWDAIGFYNTAMHEIGHILGLPHSDIGLSLMTHGDWFPAYNPSRDVVDVMTLCNLAVIYRDVSTCELPTSPMATISGWQAGYAAIFGATADYGATYRHIFGRYEKVEVFVTFFDPRNLDGVIHESQLHVVLVTADGRLLAGGSDSDLVELDPTAPFPLPIYEDTNPNSLLSNDFGGTIVVPRFPTRVVGGNMYSGPELKFTGAKYGLAGQTVQVYVGYSTHDDPEDVHYTTNPLVIQFTDI